MAVRVNARAGTRPDVGFERLILFRGREPDCAHKLVFLGRSVPGCPTQGVRCDSPDVGLEGTGLVGIGSGDLIDVVELGNGEPEHTPSGTLAGNVGEGDLSGLRVLVGTVAGGAAKDDVSVIDHIVRLRGVEDVDRGR